MRDFFYNKGDVLIAILIILVAATVIYFRVGIVMGNPDPGERIRDFLSSLPLPGQTVESVVPEANNGEEQGGGGTVQADGTDTAGTTDTQTSDDQPPAAEEPETDPPPSDGAEITITINAGDTASAVADKLLAAGVISDKQAFLSEVIAQKADSRLKQGTFKIPAGSTTNEIINILTG